MKHVTTLFMLFCSTGAFAQDWQGVNLHDTHGGTMQVPISDIDSITFSTEIPINVPSIATMPVTGISTNEATSGGILVSDGGSPLTAQGVCYSTNPDPTLANNFTNDLGWASPYASLLTGLTPDSTIYYVRAYATNAAGTAYGNEVTFATNTSVCGSLLLGQYYQGGIFYYCLQEGDIGYDINVPHGLIIAPYDVGTGPFGCSGVDLGIPGPNGTYPVYTSQSLNNSILNDCPELGIAARLCADFTLNGYSDWILPTRSELYALNSSNINLASLNLQNSLYWVIDQDALSDPALQNSSMNILTNNTSYNTPKTTILPVRAIRYF
jgi:hypothetical protein